MKDYLAKLSEGLAVSGIKATAQALNEHRVQMLILCANLGPLAGWQCRQCLALYGDMDVKPTKCSYCGRAKFYMVDVKSEMIACAYRLGSAIQIVGRSPELERLGGLGALLDGPAVSERNPAYSKDRFGLGEMSPGDALFSCADRTMTEDRDDRGHRRDAHSPALAASGRLPTTRGTRQRRRLRP
jgi:hypothetical protein